MIRLSSKSFRRLTKKDLIRLYTREDGTTPTASPLRCLFMAALYKASCNIEKPLCCKFVVESRWFLLKDGMKQASHQPNTKIHCSSKAVPFLFEIPTILSQQSIILRGKRAKDHQPLRGSQVVRATATCPNVRPVYDVLRRQRTVCFSWRANVLPNPLPKSETRCFPALDQMEAIMYHPWKPSRPQNI